MSEVVTRETIYKQTKTGAVQVWYGELDGNGAYRTVSGKEGGKLTTSEWTHCQGKNTGRSNETTAIQQAAFELDSMYRKKLEREYRRDKADVGILYYIKPMKCLKWYEDFKKRPGRGTRVAIQPKLDGMRCITGPEGSKSQDGKIVPGAPHIIEALNQCGIFEKYPALKLDGELYNHDYKEDFEELMSALKTEPETQEEIDRSRAVVQYHIYELVLAGVNYEDRLGFIEELFEEFLSQFGSMFQLVPTVIVKIDDPIQWTNKDGSVTTSVAIIEHYNDLNLERGYEGSVVSLLNDGGYHAGERRYKFKVKQFQDDEFPIEDIMEGKGNWAGHAKVIRVRLPNGNICKASVKGDKSYAKKLLEEREKHINGQSMATVSFLRYSKAGMLNLPVFKAIRTDV